MNDALVRCAACARPARPTDRFCGNCGAALADRGGRAAAEPPPARRRRTAAVAAALVGVVALVVVAGLVVRMNQMATTVRTVSTPPPSVSGAAFGQGDDARIDTAPARAAVQTAEAERTAGDRRTLRTPAAPAAQEGAAGEESAVVPGAQGGPDGGVTAAAAARVGDAERGRMDWAAPGWPVGSAAGDDLAAAVETPTAGGATDRPLTILLMGVDARPGEAIDIGVRPDALGVLRLDPADGACRMLAIPRDTRTELPGYGWSKVNHALVVGGVPYQRLVVEGLLGIELDRFVLVDFRGAVEIADAVGGVTIDVPEPFVAADGTPFAAGPQTLDGERVLAYAQYRGGPDGDLGRIRRQQQILRALLAEATDLDVVPALAGLLPVLEDHLRTDLSPAEIVGLAQRYRATCTEATLRLTTLEGQVATFDDPLAQAPLSYLVVDQTEIERKRAELLGADPE